MKLLKFWRSKAFAFNAIILMFFSAVISFICARMPEKRFSYNRWMFKERKWEKDGRIYENLFRVRSWKRFLPELSDFIKSILPKKYIKEYSISYLSKYLMESCRAEFTHWNIIASSFVFRLWNDFSGTIVVIIITAVLNLPYIIIQRYNRPRIIKIMERMECLQG